MNQYFIAEELRKTPRPFRILETFETIEGSRTRCTSLCYPTLAEAMKTLSTITLPHTREAK